MVDYNMVGPAIGLALPIVGSSIGSYIAGAASHAAMSRTEEGAGKYIAMAAAPSSHAIYGFLLMFLLKRAIDAGTLSAISAIAIGLFSGFAVMVASIYQAKVCATGIQASIKQPAVYGKCWVAVGMIESFSLFAVVFAWLLM